MPLPNFNTKHNIYIQVYIFVQVPCTILSELSKNASSNQSSLFFFFFFTIITTFQTFTGNDKFPVFAVDKDRNYFPATALEKNKKPQTKPQTQKQPTGTTVICIHQSPVSQAFKQEGGCRITSAHLIFGDCLCHH